MKKGYKSGEFVPCRMCGKEVYRTQSRLKKSGGVAYCSNKCQSALLHKNAFEFRACEMCGAKFEVSKKNSQRFCSTACQNAWQRTVVGKSNPKYNRVIMKCDWCGDDVYVRPYKIGTQEHFFCDTTCRRNWYSNAFSQSDDWKEQSKIRAVEILQSGVISQTESAPQVAVDKLLDEMDVAYEREYNITYYSIDNYLCDSGLMIEVMGDFWHTSPLKYSSPKYLQQRRAIGRDKAKHTYVKNRFDVEMLYLWETDILNNQELCKLLINEYIKKNGTLSNYHSFNYHLEDDGSLVLNDSIIIPFQELKENQQIGA